MHLKQFFKRLFQSRQKQGMQGTCSSEPRRTRGVSGEIGARPPFSAAPAVPEELQRRIAELSRRLEPKLLPKAGMMETIMGAEKNGLVLLSCGEMIGRVVGKPPKPLPLSGLFGAKRLYTGTFIAFEEGGKPFNGEINFSPGLDGNTSISFGVPDGFHRRMGGCFASIHPHFGLSPDQGGRHNVIPRGDGFSFLSGFPSTEGEFQVEGMFGIAVGNGNGSGLGKAAARLSMRGAYVGLLILETDGQGHLALHTSDFRDEEMQALARPLVTPENYVDFVIAMLGSVDSERREFARAWAKEDQVLAAAAKKAGL